MLVAFEKCKLKFVLDRNIVKSKGGANGFNPNSFMGTLIHKVLEGYYNELYDLNLFESKWEQCFKEVSGRISFDEQGINALEYIKYWVPAYYPKKLNTFKILTDYALLPNAVVSSEKIVSFKNVHGIIDLFEKNGNKVRITDFKTGELYDIDNGVNVKVKEAYISQLKAYGYIIFQTEKIEAENIELTIKGLGINQIYSFKCTREDYLAQGLRIDDLIESTNRIIQSGNLDTLANPFPKTCNFCNHLFSCNSFQNDIRIQPRKWKKIVLLKTINVKFDNSEQVINVVINDRSISIHKVPEKDFTEIKKLNENGKEILITQLFQVHNSNIKRWSKLTKYITI